MFTIETLTSFLGWCSIINMGMLTLAAIALVVLGDWVAGIHGRMFKLGENELARAYFQYLAQFKIVVLVFNVVPYVALKILA